MQTIFIFGRVSVWNNHVGPVTDYVTIFRALDIFYRIYRTVDHKSTKVTVTLAILIIFT